MISDKKAVDMTQTLVEYCKQQRGCQNCIFRKHASDHWDCNISAFDPNAALECISAKKKHHGWID